MLQIILFNLLMILFIVLAVALILAILIQRPSGGGLSGAFGAGGGSTQSAFGAKTGDVLTIVTVGFFTSFLIVACVLGLFQQHLWGGTGSSIDPPDSPSKLSVEHLYDGTNLLQWTDNSADETNFRIEISEEGIDEWSEVRLVERDIVEFIDATELDKGATYLYRVFAVNKGGDSDPSGSADVSIPVPTEPVVENETEQSDDTPITEEGESETPDETPADDVNTEVDDETDK